MRQAEVSRYSFALTEANHKELEPRDVSWTVGRLCAELQAERQANAALIALVYRLSAALAREGVAS